MTYKPSNLVIEYEILKAQNALEDKDRKNWQCKWGFYLDFDKIIIEEAAKRGISKEEYEKRTVIRKIKGSEEPDIWHIKPSTHVPGTTAGTVGWRADKDYSLEKFGPLYVSPKCTLPHECQYHYIFLG